MSGKFWEDYKSDGVWVQNTGYTRLPDDWKIFVYGIDGSKSVFDVFAHVLDGDNRVQFSVYQNLIGQDEYCYHSSEDGTVIDLDSLTTVRHKLFTKPEHQDVFEANKLIFEDSAKYRCSIPKGVKDLLAASEADGGRYFSSHVCYKF